MDFELKNSTLYIKGQFDYSVKKQEIAKLKALSKSAKTLDLGGLALLDYAAAYLLKEYFSHCQLQNASAKNEQMLAFVGFESYFVPKPHSLNLIEHVGQRILGLKQQWMRILNFLGATISMIFFYILAPWKIRFRELSNHIKEAGVQAISIVCLTAFLIGIVLAYQGAVMLERFGASVLVVDIMGIITLREIAPLIAAIVVAGRSASSYAAQIGVMKITEELYAMDTMGFKPFSFVVMPRILALIVAMPLVIFWADLISIFGQMAVCKWYLNLDFGFYLNRFSSNVDIRHFIVGMIKAPIFGAVIALIGCMRGYAVDGSTESVGKQTTRSVVNAIFWIIALDAAFSIIFTELEI